MIRLIFYALLWAQFAGIGGNGQPGYGGGGSCSTSSTQGLYDADSLSASPITVNWPDTSGNSRDMVPTASPTWAASQFNGHAAVITNGSTQAFACYSTCGSGTTGIPLGTITTIYWVGSLTSTSGKQAITSNAFTSGNTLEAYVDTGTPGMDYQFTANIANATASINTSGHVVVYSYNKSTGAWSFFIDGTAAGSGTNLQGTSAGIDTLLSAGPSTQFLGGKTTLIAITNAAYDSTYNSCLRTRYGI